MPAPSELVGQSIVYRPAHGVRYTQATVVHVTPVQRIAGGQVVHLAHLNNSEQVVLEDCFLPIPRT